MTDTELRAAANDLPSVTPTAVLLVDDSPLVIDHVPYLAQVGDRCVVDQVSCLIQCATRVPSANGLPPLSGLFLNPPATQAQAETLATAGAAFGWNALARGYVIPLADPSLTAGRNNVPGNFAGVISLVSRPGFRIVVPYGWSIRAILICEAGLATPGPGAGSTGSLRVFGSVERMGSC